MKKLLYYLKKISCLIIFVIFSSSFVNSNENVKINIEEKNILKIDTLNNDGTFNALVEIPSGSIEKWEVAKDFKTINLEFKEGRPRIVEYSPYPFNYGIIINTL